MMMFGIVQRAVVDAVREDAEPRDYVAAEAREACDAGTHFAAVFPARCSGCGAAIDAVSAIVWRGLDAYAVACPECVAAAHDVECALTAGEPEPPWRKGDENAL